MKLFTIVFMLIFMHCTGLFAKWKDNDLRYLLAESQPTSELTATGYIQKMNQGPRTEYRYQLDNLMPWNHPGYQVQWFHAGSFNSVGIAKGVTLEEAIRIANLHPEISYFAYGKATGYVVDLMGVSCILYGDAVFFSGSVPNGPIPGSVDQSSYFMDSLFCDGYIKTGNIEDVVDLSDPIPYFHPPRPFSPREGA